MKELYAFPLSLAQERLWILSHFGGGSEAYTVSVAYEITGSIDPDVLDQSLRFVIERHESLRTTFETSGATAVQVVSKAIPGPLRWTSLIGCDDEARRAAVAEELTALSSVRFDLENGPLVRVRLIVFDDTSSVISLAMHHIVSDGWSMRVFLKELAEAYAAISEGRPVELPPLSIQFADFAVWQRTQLDDHSLSARLRFWKHYLAGAQGFLPLPTDRPRPALQSFHGDVVSFRLEPEVVGPLRKLAQEGRATTFMVLLSAFSLLLSRYTGETDLLVGCPSRGREAPELEPLIGFFVNTLVLRMDLTGDPSFREMLGRVRKSVLTVQAEQEIPFEKLVEGLGVESSPSHNPLFQVMFAYDTEDLGCIEFADMSLKRIRVGNRPSKFDLTMILAESSGALQGEIEFKTDLFDRSTVERLVDHFRQLLRSIAADPDSVARRLPMVTTDEREQFRLWNSTPRPYPPGLRLPDLVLAQAARRPDATAIEVDGQTISYRHLTERAARFARTLQGAGAGAATTVGIQLEPSAEMLISVLGVLMAGAAYVPLDPNLPAPRLERMVKDAAITALVCDSRSSRVLPPFAGTVLDWADDLEAAGSRGPDLVLCPLSESSLAYLMYTSGSTGVPKAVAVEHRSVVNLLLSMAETLHFGESDGLLAVTPLSFDISILELFLPLITGGRLSIVPRTVAVNGERLAAAIRRSDANWMQATPSTWQLLREAGWEGGDRFTALCGGESLPEDLSQWLTARAGALWNMYGPTETTIWSLVHRMSSQDPRVKIGRPIANTRAYVLDRDLQQVPVGVPGELYLSGTGLARGYRNDPARTASAFVANPFESGARMYGTGDRVRFAADGALEFLGRSDTQIKFRGHRIDLGDIEAHLRDLPGVREAVVMFEHDTTGEPLLAAYLVPFGAPTAAESLRVLLGQRLPDYMIPAAFEFLDALPLTPNGKVNRKALPRPSSRQRRSGEFTPPRNQLEHTLAGIWMEVLGLERVGVHETFLSLGGASLQCVRIVNRARKVGLRISPENIFELQTIAAVAASCAAEDPAHAGAAVDDVEPLAGVDVDAYFADEDAALPRTAARSVVIESLGMYLPANAVSSADVVKNCRTPLRFPLQRVTGIKSRRMTLGEEFSIDIARKAVADALSRSKYRAGDIDLLICCNISRFDGPLEATFEPSTSSRLAAEMGLTRAITLDVSNGCAGVFTGLYVANAFLKTGIVRTAMVVSGEYITHLTTTAQKEVKDYLDPRIACLTLGDSGVAMVLEPGRDGSDGFQFFDMFTLGAYSKLCIARNSGEDHGGAIMYTDAVAMAEKGFEPGARHTLESMKRARWKPESVDHLIVHQTASITIDATRKEINKLFGREVCHDRNLINNLADRGNTATTSHFVALMDHIANGNIRSGSNVMFSISGSGMTFGTALYRMNDLPDRIRARRGSAAGAAAPLMERIPTGRTAPSGVRILHASKAMAAPSCSETLDLLASASRDCLRAAAVDESALDLLIHTGVYRTDFIVEPAIAAMLAGELGINSSLGGSTGNRTFAFDVLDGAVGFLKACYVTTGMMQAGIASVAMIVTAEVENNRTIGEPLLGIAEAGSAAILARRSEGQTGFAGFYFEQDAAHLGSFRSHWTCDGPRHFIRFFKDPALDDVYAAAIAGALQRFLEREQIAIAEISRVIPPQISPEFSRKLATVLGIPLERFVIVDDAAGDLHSSSIPIALHEAFQRELVSPGDVGLFIAVGSGVQVGLALYHF